MGDWKGGWKGKPPPSIRSLTGDDPMVSEIDDKLPFSSGLGSVEFVFRGDDVVQLLKAAIEQEGSQVAFAKHHGINRTYLNMVLSGKRPVGDAVAETLGLHKVYVVNPADRCETEIAPKAKRELVDA